MALLMPSVGRNGVLGAAVLGALASGPAWAQPYSSCPGPSPDADPYSYSPDGYPGAPPDARMPYGDPQAADPGVRCYRPPPSCCVVPAGTAVAVRLVDPVGTHDAKTGDTFRLRLAAPVIVGGQVVLPAGAAGLGRVVQSSGPGLGGKGAKLVVAAEYLVAPNRTVPLQGLQLAGTGKDRSLTANAASLVGGFIFMPLGLVGLAVRGGEVEVPAETTATAKIAEAVTLPPLAAATAQDYEDVRALFGEPQTSSGWFDVPVPPPGMGQVVFFREPSLLGIGQWFKVREHGRALGKLTNGAYFIVPMTPGLHSYTAVSEPELRDRLTLRIDPGETYYVEGIMTKGVVIGAADLTPSDKARFDEVSGELEGVAISRHGLAAGAPPQPGAPQEP
jgi:hypothetical protein